MMIIVVVVELLCLGGCWIVLVVVDELFLSLLNPSCRGGCYWRGGCFLIVVVVVVVVLFLSWQLLNRFCHFPSRIVMRVRLKPWSVEWKFRSSRLLRASRLPSTIPSWPKPDRIRWGVMLAPVFHPYLLSVAFWILPRHRVLSFLLWAEWVKNRRMEYRATRSSVRSFARTAHFAHSWESEWLDVSEWLGFVP